MDYLSTSKAAEKWGLTPARVRALAREGKIEGAKLVGKSWLIPSSAKRPLDGRTRAAHASGQAPLSCRFPLYLYDIDANDPLVNDLDAVQRALFEAEVLVAKCQFQEAKNALRAFVDSTEDPLLKAGALHQLCLCHMALSEPLQFQRHANELSTLAAKESDFQALFGLILSDLEAYYKGNPLRQKGFSLSSQKNVAPGVLSFLAVGAIYLAKMDCIATQRVPRLLSLELNCAALERDGHLYAALNAHLHLAFVCYCAGSASEMTQHIDRAVDIAFENEYLFPLALHIPYMGNDLRQSLERHSASFANQVDLYGQAVHRGYQSLMSAVGEQQLYALINATDITYLTMALKGLTNKEIATEMGVSQVTVSRHFSAICKKLSAQNKKELIDLVKLSAHRYDFRP